MSTERRRRRRGRHESVGGGAATEALQDLVGQFADPHAFVRELIQNSLDAGASSIEVVMDYADAILTVAVIDDGSGMDRETIEGYLLTLFRSTKEDDLTKIGKFGIGFVSLFAIGPTQVVVDTGRDSIWLQVVFAADRSYTLYEKEDPYEGTTVTLNLERKAKEAQKTCELIHQSAEKWCRFVDADIFTTASGIAQGWDARLISADFTVDSPMLVQSESDGFLAIMGPSPSPQVGFYCRGLTLWESESPILAGVSFKVEGRHLEHTLTRDNVLRNRHYKLVMHRLKAMVNDVGKELTDAIVAAVAEGNYSRVNELFGCVAHEVAWSWDRRVPLIPAVGREPLSINDLAGGLLGKLWQQVTKGTPLYFGSADDPLANAVAASGQTVVVATSKRDPLLAWAVRWGHKDPQPVAKAFVMALPIELKPQEQALFEATKSLVEKHGSSFELFPGELLGDALKGRLALNQTVAYQVDSAEASSLQDRHIVIASNHHLFQELLHLPPALGAPLLLRAALLDAGRTNRPDPDQVVSAAIAALETP
ncbi:MAG: hypothetical protein HN348_04220 [Proteobacteria bacterium]|jgi:hypothetical protein|nr:hypothetical protein [Pseudomonadota bacterium]